MKNFPERARQTSLLIMLCALGLFSWTNGATQAPPNSVCPTCETRVGAEAADSDEVTARGASTSSACDVEQVPLTQAAEQAFDLEQLRAFLVDLNTVEGRFVEGVQSPELTEQTATTIELSFELGEFSYYTVATESDGCSDEVRAAAHVRGRVGNDLLLFEADGVLQKRENRASAWFYASSDLAMATGSYEPDLDRSRIHAGSIEISVFVAPGELRGDINSAVYYFDDEAQVRRRQEGDWFAFTESQNLFQLGFPGDECEDHELPFAHNLGIQLLRGQSPDQLREHAASRIAESAQVDAVWQDGRATQLTIELGEPIEGTVCLVHGRPFSQMNLNSDWVVRIPILGRLRSGDARLDVPLDKLFVGVDATAISGASLRGWVPAASLNAAQTQALGPAFDVLDIWINYDFDRNSPRLSGIVYLLSEVRPGSYRWTDCVAFPPGGDRDTRECRYRR
jgi:hypothetical protein